MRLTIAVIAFISCQPFGAARKLSGSDCVTDALDSIASCAGTDHTFTECRYYWRASGRPRRTLCESLVARPQPATAVTLHACEGSEFWSELHCADYSLPGSMRCFGCTDAKHEAVRTKIYAFSKNCETAWEQATCNFDPKQVKASLEK